MGDPFMLGRSAPKPTEKQNKLNQQKLTQLIGKKENRLCADCEMAVPEWASVNIGCFVCIRCSGLHRQLGTHVSKVRSVRMDMWQPDQIATMELNGNKRINQKYEERLKRSTKRSMGLANDQACFQFIKDKYEHKRWYRKKKKKGKETDKKKSRKKKAQDSDSEEEEAANKKTRRKKKQAETSDSDDDSSSSDVSSDSEEEPPAKPAKPKVTKKAAEPAPVIVKKPKKPPTPSASDSDSDSSNVFSSEEEVVVQPKKTKGKTKASNPTKEPKGSKKSKAKAEPKTDSAGLDSLDAFFSPAPPKSSTSTGGGLDLGSFFGGSAMDSDSSPELTAAAPKQATCGLDLGGFFSGGLADSSDDEAPKGPAPGRKFDLGVFLNDEMADTSVTSPSAELAEILSDNHVAETRPRVQSEAKVNILSMFDTATTASTMGSGCSAAVRTRASTVPVQGSAMPVTSAAGPESDVFGKGEIVSYIPTGEAVEIIAVHTEDLSPYYTVQMQNLCEKQTTQDKLERSNKPLLRPADAGMEKDALVIEAPPSAAEKTVPAASNAKADADDEAVRLAEEKAAAALVREKAERIKAEEQQAREAAELAAAQQAAILAAVAEATKTNLDVNEAKDEPEAPTAATAAVHIEKDDDDASEEPANPSDNVTQNTVPAASNAKADADDEAVRLAEEKAAAALVREKAERIKAEEQQAKEAAEQAAAQQAAIMAAVAAATAAAMGGTPANERMVKDIGASQLGLHSASHQPSVVDDDDDEPQASVKIISPQDDDDEEEDEMVTQLFATQLDSTAAPTVNSGYGDLDDFDAGDLEDGFLSD